MKQINIIPQLKAIFPKIKGLEIALLYGSLARNERNPNSDIDIQIIVNEEFEVEVLKKEMNITFHSEVQDMLDIALRNKIVWYFKSMPKLEISIYTKLEDINRNYIGSEITDVENSVLYERDSAIYNIHSYLAKLISANPIHHTDAEKAQEIAALVHKFMYEFESCSDAHRRSDGYKFYFFYNIALHTMVQIFHLAKGERKFNFLPKNLINNHLTKEEKPVFYDLNCSLSLLDANTQKRKLLDFFYTTIQSDVSSIKEKEVEIFCEWVYERDKLWNFRDIGLLNSNIKKGLVYRTSTLSLLKEEGLFSTIIAKHNIKTIIDLRASQEIEALSYSENALAQFRYIKAPFDPWNQPEWFKETNHYGTNNEIAYRFFILACKDAIKKGIEAILSENQGAIAIHCHAGKDRTGIFISLLHLLIETPLEIVYQDYLATESDTKAARLEMVLAIIEQQGGIDEYLTSCGLNECQLTQLKHKLQHGNN